MMIAELFTPTSLELGGWIVSAWAVLGFLNQGAKFIDRFKERPPPHETYQPKGDYALRSELQQLKLDLQTHLQRQDGAIAEIASEIGAMREKMDTDKGEILKADEERIGGVHERVNDVLEAVSELRGIVNQMRH